MQRSEFLKLSLAGLGSLAFSSMGAEGRSTEQKTVIIVGAGMAGAAAARSLTDAGFKVTVLEARDRVGGRIHTFRDWDIPLELGAGWIHSGYPDAEVLMKLARRYQVSTANTDYRKFKLFTEQGNLVSPLKAERLYEDVVEKRLLDEVVKIQQAHQDYSVAQVFDRALRGVSLDNESRAIVSFYREGFANSLNTQLDQVSARYYLNQAAIQSQQRDALVTNGFDTIVRALLQDIEVQHNVVVKHIAPLGEGVKVETLRGNWEANYVIVTVPLSILQQQHITFASEFSDAKKKALSSLRTGLFNKVIMQFSEPFWKDSAHLLAFQNSVKDSFGIVVNYHHFTGKPMLVAMPITRAAQWVEQDPEAVQKKWQAILQRAFPNKNIDIERVKISQWHSDPFARGAYSYVPVGSSKQSFEALAEPVGPVHFAGEATESDNHGTVHGAYLSGLREAQRIIRL